MFPYTILPPPFALSAMWQKNLHSRVRYRDGDSENVSGPNPQSLSLSLCCLPGSPPRLFLCPVSSTARQRYASTLPCAQLRTMQRADVHTIYCPLQIGSLLWCFVQSSHLLFSTFSHKRLNIQRLGGGSEGRRSWFKEQMKAGRTEWELMVDMKPRSFFSKVFSYIHTSVKRFHPRAQSCRWNRFQCQPSISCRGPCSLFRFDLRCDRVGQVTRELSGLSTVWLLIICAVTERQLHFIPELMVDIWIITVTREKDTHVCVLRTLGHVNPERLKQVVAHCLDQLLTLPGLL